MTPTRVFCWFLGPCIMLASLGELSNPSRSSSRSSSTMVQAPLLRTKVIVRKLPPGLTEEGFRAAVDKAAPGSYSWLSYQQGKVSARKTVLSKAYLNFNEPRLVLEFKAAFDGHVFVTTKGKQYKCTVEYAPYQKVPAPPKKKNPLEGTIEQDPHYQAFLAELQEGPQLLPSAAVQREQRDKEMGLVSVLAGAPGSGTKATEVVTSPLLEYLREQSTGAPGRKASGQAQVPLAVCEVCFTAVTGFLRDLLHKSIATHSTSLPDVQAAKPTSGRPPAGGKSDKADTTRGGKAAAGTGSASKGAASKDKADLPMKAAQAAMEALSVSSKPKAGTPTAATTGKDKEAGKGKAHQAAAAALVGAKAPAPGPAVVKAILSRPKDAGASPASTQTAAASAPATSKPASKPSTAQQSGREVAPAGSRSGQVPAAGASGKAGGSGSGPAAPRPVKPQSTVSSGQSTGSAAGGGGGASSSGARASSRPSSAASGSTAAGEAAQTPAAAAAAATAAVAGTGDGSAQPAAPGRRVRAGFQAYRPPVRPKPADDDD